MTNPDNKEALSLPEGTVTFLFTDIEGSTELLNQLGDQAELLEEQRGIVRVCFEEFDEQEVEVYYPPSFVI